jgi:hypothetical protein
MNEPNAPYEQQSAPAPQLPPLRIHHILVATAVTAVFLSFAQALQRNEIGGLSEFIASGTGVLYAVTTSLALTAVGFGLYWRRRGIPFFHQPGPWLMVTQALGAWIVFVFAIILIYPATERNAMGGLFFALLFLGLNLAVISVDFWAAWRVGDTPWWRLLFITKGAMVIATFALPFIVRPTQISHANLGMYLLIVILLVAAASTDRLHRRARDWLHWVGVVMSAAVYLAVTAPLLFEIIAPRITG